MEYTVQNLEYAVSVFYNGEQDERTKAHSWLTTAQRVPEAWQFVWELLQPNKGTEIQFYAATTLHTKILRCWNEVPPESYEELKQKLLHSVIAYSNGPKIVTNRLCISLAAFILQQGSKELAEILRPLSSAENSSLLLEVLTVIPEEFHSMTMGTALRAKNRIALNEACRMVLDDMLRYMQSAYNDFSKEPPNNNLIQLWTTVATCAASWLTHNEIITLPETVPLCQALLTAVHVLYTHCPAEGERAVEACEACLGAVRVAAGAAGTERYRGAALQLLADLAALAAPLLRHHSRPLQQPPPNEELLSALVTCCVAVTECHTKVLFKAVTWAESERRGASLSEEGEEFDLQAAEGARLMLELLLAAQAAPGHYPIHETHSNLVLNFWSSLQDEVYDQEYVSKKDPLWNEVFSQLLLTLIKKSEMPPESTLSRDDQELLRCYRQDIADVALYSVNVLRGECWDIVLSALASAQSESAREAALHVFGALADAARPEVAPGAHQALLDAALAVCADHTKHATPTLTTALDCLGAHAAWLGSLEAGSAWAARGGAARMAGACVRAAGAALARCPAAAALALRRLCDECAAPAAALAPDIVAVAQSNSPGLDAWSRRQVLSAAGAALAASEPARAAPLLRELADHLCQELAAQAAEGTMVGAAEFSAALMSALAPQPPLAADLFRGLLPALRLLPARQDYAEPMLHILKHTVSSLMDDCKYIINDIEELLMPSVTAYPSAVGLDVVKLVVVLCGEWAGCAALVRAATAAAARAHLDELFSLLYALTKKRPVVIDWIEQQLPEFIDMACAAVRQWEHRARACAACGWLAALAGTRAPALRRRGPALTVALLQAIACVTPSSPQQEALAALLLALNRHADGLPDWLRAALAPHDFPTAHAHPHKQRFLTRVLQEKHSRRRLVETVQDFSLACRGLIDTEYARQTIASRQLVA